MHNLELHPIHCPGIYRETDCARHSVMTGSCNPVDCSPQAPLPMGFPMALVGLVYYYLCDPTADFKAGFGTRWSRRASNSKISLVHWNHCGTFWSRMEGVSLCRRKAFSRNWSQRVPQTPVLRSCSPLSTDCQRLHGLCGTQNCRDPLSSRLL